MSEATAGAFWRFSLARYAAPGVADACLALQDRDGADVNLILLALWLGERGQRLEAEAGGRLAQLAADWQGPVIAPLRAVRRRLKERASGQCGGEITRWRGRIAEAELALERIEQLMLEQAVGPIGGAPPHGGAARGNLIALGLGHLADSTEWADLLATVGRGP
ncbi:MAG: TIGR02444 family protein [Geminicoccaceae bacterium]